VDNLSKMGRHREAAVLLPELRELAAAQGGALDPLRLRWVEGRVAAGLGRARARPPAPRRHPSGLSRWPESLRSRSRHPGPGRFGPCRSHGHHRARVPHQPAERDRARARTGRRRTMDTSLGIGFAFIADPNKILRQAMSSVK
jgi:hypothetical protein